MIAEANRFPTLADEISSIKEALEGAPVHAKEAVLKILERLTQRVDRAERERDLATSRYRELQLKLDQVEEELAKKRGELRELLRQDSARGASHKRMRQSESSGELSPDGSSSVEKASDQSGCSLKAEALPKIELNMPARVIEEMISPRARSRSSPRSTASASARAEDRQDTELIKHLKVDTFVLCVLFIIINI